MFITKSDVSSESTTLLCIVMNHAIENITKNMMTMANSSAFMRDGLEAIECLQVGRKIMVYELGSSEVILPMNFFDRLLKGGMLIKTVSLD